MAEVSMMELDPTGRNVHGEVARLRESGPAALVLLPGEVRAWSVTRPELIKRLAGDPRVSRDPRRHWPAMATVPADWPLNAFVQLKSLITAYGEDHRRLRKPLSGTFGRRRLELLRPRIEEIVDQLIDGMDADAGAPICLRERFAAQAPAEVMWDLFGVPDSLRARFSSGLPRFTNTAATPDEAGAAFNEMVSCAMELLAAKRVFPGQDLATDLVEGQASDPSMTDEVLIHTLITMLGAGIDTTSNHIANAARALAVDPVQRRLAVSGEVGWDDVVEESLRRDGPVMHLPLRFAVEDFDLEGVTIKQGEAILLAFGAPGRDPGWHVDAHEFDLTRSEKDHLAFGYGVHYCVGAPLARLEGAIALERLFTRFPDLELAVPSDELVPHTSFIGCGFQSLPVNLRPRVHAER
ncbi:cytochrome P450 [Saccharopolyspora shandongensis]|uniref:cytochrome P450 family protein n=1 Tax=Saccharopolyspora shandongensis TaxID=418495 RepID=UPI0033F3F03C